jgi:hypothetical protein
MKTFGSDLFEMSAPRPTSPIGLGQVPRRSEVRAGDIPALFTADGFSTKRVFTSFGRDGA